MNVKESLRNPIGYVEALCLSIQVMTHEIA